MDSHACQSSPALLGGVVLPGAQHCSGWRQLVDLRRCSQAGVSVRLLSLPLRCSDFCWWHCIVLGTGVEACKSVRARDPEKRNSNLFLHPGNIYVAHGVLDCKKQASVLTVTSEDLCTVHIQSNDFHFSNICHHWKLNSSSWLSKYFISFYKLQKFATVGYSYVVT